MFLQTIFNKATDFFVDLNYNHAVISGDETKIKRLIEKWPKSSYDKYILKALSSEKYRICKVLCEHKKFSDEYYYRNSHLFASSDILEMYEINKHDRKNYWNLSATDS